jgi:DMSO/TMAO reductase YedYZ molybdopterin-dependent catalytic subunit
MPVPAAESLPATAPAASRLRSVEVTSYQGKPLDKVSAEPETSIKGPQHIAVESYRLEVTGLVRTPLSLTYGEVLALPSYQKATTLNCIDGWSVTYLWQGVLLKDLLAKAGYDPTASLVVFRCYDGYSESLPLDYVVNRNILLAYGMNRRVMPPERGFPFQVVAEDRYGYKWAKWVTGIEVSNDTRFRGHYEKMGADNTATIPAGK